ncbi:MAG: HAD family phosphatase [Lachnospiraceae bacterium]|nr:HAD family phosphatase [Lachnospiraceae bacterium]
MSKLLLFDLDGTLLRTDKTVSNRTLEMLERCRNMGYLVGIVTSRSEQNSLSFLGRLKPDILITSGGALVKSGDEYIYKAIFSKERTCKLIQTARDICGIDTEITIDTLDTHYWNYKIDPKELDQSWGDSVWTDFIDFAEESLKMCVEIFDDGKAQQLIDILDDCDSIRFSDGFWYKFTLKGVTKENSIEIACRKLGINTSDVIAFGDDYADIGMLKMAGIGVAMGNAIDEVKLSADVVIETNDNDGIALYLEKLLQ